MFRPTNIQKYKNNPLITCEHDLLGESSEEVAPSQEVQDQVKLALGLSHRF